MNRKFLSSLLVLSMILGGCKYATLLVTDPRQMIEAKYKMAKGKKIAVLVDDYLSPINNPDMKKDLAMLISDGLIQAQAVRAGDMISTDKVYETPKESPDGKKLSIQRIGKDVGADYVIYVNIIDFNLQSDPENPLIKPKAKAFVKLVEVSTGERLWPIDMSGEPIEATSRVANDIASEATDTTKWTQELIDTLASQTVGMFFDHRE